MQSRTQILFQTYNDGICRIAALENIATPGNQPREGLRVRADRVPYERRRVGVQRFYSARQENTEIEMVIRIPGAFPVSTQDICIIDNRQYGIYQAQDALDIIPPAKDLSLRRLEEHYDTAGVSGYSADGNG